MRKGLNSSSSFPPPPLYAKSYTVDVLYWYTRTTTEGLSWRAQCLSLGAFAFKTIGLFVTMRNVDWSFSIVFEKGTQLVFTFIPALLKLAVLFRIDISRDGITKRPMTKGEKLSRRLDDRVGWRIPVTVSCQSRLFLEKDDVHPFTKQLPFPIEGLATLPSSCSNLVFKQSRSSIHTA